MKIAKKVCVCTAHLNHLTINVPAQHYRFVLAIGAGRYLWSTDRPDKERIQDRQA